MVMCSPVSSSNATVRLCLAFLACLFLGTRIFSLISVSLPSQDTTLLTQLIKLETSVVNYGDVLIQPCAISVLPLISAH